MHDIRQRNDLKTAGHESCARMTRENDFAFAAIHQSLDRIAIKMNLKADTQTDRHNKGKERPNKGREGNLIFRLNDFSFHSQKCKFWRPKNPFGKQQKVHEESFLRHRKHH